jgi:hypothetical protein
MDGRLFVIEYPVAREPGWAPQGGVTYKGGTAQVESQKLDALGVPHRVRELSHV